MSFLDTLFRPIQPVPGVYKNLFNHLYMDVVWFGVLNGSTLAFLSIYATRLGGNPVQIALISAAPALINLLLALPVGNWLGTKPTVALPVFWGGLFSRLFYLVLIILPWLLSNSVEITVILAIILIMNIPGTIMVVGFTALFGETVPPVWRGHVAGVRNGMLSIFTFLVTLGCGQILAHMAFPMGYQVVFIIGFIGAMMSTYHVWYIRPLVLEDIASKSFSSPLLDENHANAAQQILESFGQLLRVDIIRGRFGRVVGLLFFFHLMQYIPIPLFPIYQVNVLHFPDQIISLGLATFYLTVFLGSTQLSRLVNHWGNHLVIGWGMAFMSVYSILMAVSFYPIVLIVTSFLGGLAYAMLSGTIFNYLLEFATDLDRPVYLAWYNIGLNAAILIGSLGGALIAEKIGIATTLVVFGIGRVIAGLAILQWG